jgi:hypothetical protein
MLAMTAGGMQHSLNIAAGLYIVIATEPGFTNHLAMGLHNETDLLHDSRCTHTVRDGPGRAG